MTEFDAIVAKAKEIYERKGADYTIGKAEEDRLANFRATSEMLGISMMQAWAVHFYKHVSAIFAFAKTGKVESEGIEGRLLDVINYAILGILITKQNPKQLELPLGKAVSVAEYDKACKQVEKAILTATEEQVWQPYREYKPVFHSSNPCEDPYCKVCKAFSNP